MSLPVVAILSKNDSPRLRYALDWVFKERLGLEYRLTLDADTALAGSPCLAYGWHEHLPSVHASTFLWEDDLRPQDISRAEWEGIYALFFEEDGTCDLQFDLFASVFFLLSRYEEYLPFTQDRHGRFPAEQSVIFPVLERPVLDEAVEALRVFLEDVWSIPIPGSAFAFRPTYDIDIAWSFRFKGWWRTLGSSLKDAASRNWKQLNQRIRVRRGLENDPYDSFIWILTQHMESNPKPAYFVLAAKTPSDFDKNINPRHPRMSSLIKALSMGVQVGMHPSYYSDLQPEKMAEEKSTLEGISGHPVSISRQHYIKLRFPGTYKALVAAGITDDYSMGYSTHFGFRAGTGASFQWYDLSEEKVKPLRIHPFAFMDSTGHYDLGLSPEEAFNRLRQIAVKLQACGSTLITIMHNYSLGTDAEWRGWRREYERFLIDVQKTTGNAAD